MDTLNGIDKRYLTLIELNKINKNRLKAYGDQNFVYPNSLTMTGHSIFKSLNCSTWKRMFILNLASNILKNS